MLQQNNSDENFNLEPRLAGFSFSDRNQSRPRVSDVRSKGGQPLKSFLREPQSAAREEKSVAIKKVAAKKIEPAKKVSEPKLGVVKREPVFSARSWRNVGERRSRRFKFIIIASAVIFLAVGLFIVNYFAYAKITVTPKQAFVDVSSTMKASVVNGADVGLEAVNFEDSIEFTAKSSGGSTQKTESKAKGLVVIFNAFSGTPQVLVKNTRLEAPNGKIYRIENAVTVPGAKIENGKLTPQGVEVGVVADGAGESYDLGLSDFTIPGFKGSPKYEKFYGRSKTEIKTGVLAGGSLSDGDAKELLAKGEGVFEETFRNKIAKDLPEGVFLPNGAYEIESKIESIEALTDDPSAGVKVKIKGTLRGLALKEEELDQFLGDSYLGEGEGDKIYVENRGGLSYEIVNKDFAQKLLTLKIKGRAHFVWRLDEENLKKDLISSGSNRRDAFMKQRSIERAEIAFVPFWWRIFPSSPQNIRVNLIIKSQ